MSDVLRRPMFRMGGQVNSQGTGIMSGVEPRMNYQIGGPVYMPTTGSFEEAYKTKQKQEQILSRIPTYESAEQDYEKRILDLQRDIDMFSSPEDVFVGEQKAKELDFLQSPRGKEAFIGEKLAEREKKIQEAKGAGVTEDRLPKTAGQIAKSTEVKKPKPTKPLLPGAGDGPKTVKELEESDLKTIYKDLLPLFEKELGPEEDEFRRQKYMQLAKFGLGLLAQPGGSLVEAVGKAGAEPLAGLESAAAREAQARKAPRIAALEAALKQAEPGKYGQAVRDLKKLGISEERAVEIATQSGTATKQRTYESVVENLQSSLAEQGIVTDKSAARGTAKDLLKAEGLGVKTYEFEKFPKDGSAIEGKYYIMDNGRSGRYYKGQLIEPGEEGFTGELPE
jgi:hypothetical protein